VTCELENGFCTHKTNNGCVHFLVLLLMFSFSLSLIKVSINQIPDNRYVVVEQSEDQDLSNKVIVFVFEHFEVDFFFTEAQTFLKEEICSRCNHCKCCTLPKAFCFRFKKVICGASAADQDHGDE